MPLLAVNQRISSWEDIQTVAPLAGPRPVYLLVGSDESCIVIKQEVGAAQDAANLKFVNRAMRTVSPAFASKVCTPNEVTVLNDFVQWMAWTTNHFSLPYPAEIDHLEKSLKNGGVWFKMEKAEGILDLKEAVQKALNQQDKSGIRKITKALNATGGLEAVGKIIVADLFSGNTDRFNPYNTDYFSNDVVPAGDINPRTQTKFHVMLNLGNVLVSVQNKKLRPIGLDAYEAQGEWRQMDKKVSVLESKNEKWPGRHLMNDSNEEKWRKDFAAMVAADLEAALGPRNRKVAWGRTQRLQKNAATRIFNGMEAGIRELKTNFAQYVRKQGAQRPAGLTDRLQILGW